MTMPVTPTMSRKVSTCGVRVLADRRVEHQQHRVRRRRHRPSSARARSSAARPSDRPCCAAARPCRSGACRRRSLLRRRRARRRRGRPRRRRPARVITGDAGALAPDLELLDRGGAERVAGGEHARSCRHRDRACASLPIVVVLPLPLTPTTSITNGFLRGIERQRLLDRRQSGLDDFLGQGGADFLGARLPG